MGFNPRLAPYSFSVQMCADPTGDEEIDLFRFPVAGRVLDAWATNSAGIAATTHTVGLYLMQYTSATAPLVVGSLGSWAEGTTWVADIPRQMTMTSFGSTASFTVGQWIRLKYAETGSGLWTEMGIQVDYLLGYDV